MDVDGNGFDGNTASGGCGYGPGNVYMVLVLMVLHLLLFITRKYTIINANPKLINAKIHSFYSIGID